MLLNKIYIKKEPGTENPTVILKTQNKRGRPKKVKNDGDVKISSNSKRKKNSKEIQLKIKEEPNDSTTLISGYNIEEVNEKPRQSDRVKRKYNKSLSNSNIKNFKRYSEAVVSIETVDRRGMRSKPKKRNFKCMHPECQLNFSSRLDVSTHYALNHTGEKLFGCHCGGEF